MVTLRQLRYLAAVAEYRHFGRAAEACAVTQPALSMQIRELERQLLLPRHALHATKLAIEGEGEWTSPLPVDLAKFLEGQPPCRLSYDAAERVPP